MRLQDLADASIKQSDYTVAFIEDDMPILDSEKPNHTFIRVFSNILEYCSIEEFVDELKDIKTLANKFDFEVADASIAADDFPEHAVKAVEYNKEEQPVYDTTLHIPYTTTDNFARHLAQHCVLTSLKTYPTHGVIGCDRLNAISLGTIANRVNEICSLDLDMYAKKGNGNNMLDSNNLPHPIGRCLSITFMQYPVGTGNGYMYTSSGAAGYAGMVSTLDADKSSTNQPISLPTLAFELSNYQLSKLTGKGIVTVKTTTQGTVVTDGVTMAPVDSAYRRLSTTKVINVVDAALREVIEPYIGSQDNLATRNSLQTAITSRLNKLKEKLISYYKFNIISDSSAARLGIIKVQYVVIPYNEIKEVRNTLSVQESN